MGEEGIRDGQQAGVGKSRDCALRNYWSASYPVYGPDVLGLLEVLLDETGTLHSPGSKYPLTLGVTLDLRGCSSMRRAS